MTESVETVEKTYYDLAREFQAAEREITAKKQQVERDAYAIYTEATRVARERQRAAYDEANEQYNKDIAGDDKMLNAANETAKKVADEESAALADKLAEGTNLKNVKLMSWMLANRVWSNYSSYCEPMLNFLDKKERTLAEVMKFASREQGWCSTFQTYLLQAHEAGVVPFEMTPADVVRVKFDIEMTDKGFSIDVRERLLTAIEELGVDSEGVQKLIAAFARN